MQTARQSLRQQVPPYAPGAIGPIARQEAGAHLHTKRFVAPAALTARSCQPGIEATPRDTERPAHPVHGPDSPVLRNEGELHVVSFAKKAAAFFRMSRSAFSFATSRLRRTISSCSGFIWPLPGKACCGSSENFFTQSRSLEVGT